MYPGSIPIKTHFYRSNVLPTHLNLMESLHQIRLALAVTLSTMIRIVCPAQSHHAGEATATPGLPTLQFTSVLSQKLTDARLGSYSLQSQVMQVPAGFSDTVAHRHEGELFGYVLEGSVEVQMEKSPLTRYEAGQMFYEPVGRLHRVLRNPHPDQPAKVLLLFIIGQGKQAYRREYPEAAGK